MPCPRCLYTNKNIRCKNKTCKSPYCYIHANYKGLDLSSGNFKYRIKESNIPNSGLGLFLSKKATIIPRGKILNIYSGERISKKKIDTIYNDTDNKAEYVLCAGNKKNSKCIDGKSPFELPGRFANDCTNCPKKNIKQRRKCNAEFGDKFIKEKINGKIFNIVTVKTTKKIKPGDEILINYGDEYWIK